MKKNFYLLVLVFALSSCSTLSKQECANKDWYGEGYQVGLNGGQPTNQFMFFKQNCGDEHGIQPDMEKFETGFKAGRNVMCTKDGGYQFGLNGGAYTDQCPKEKEDAFFSGYQRGQTIYTGQKLSSMEERIEDLERQNRSKDQKIMQLQNELQLERSRHR